MKIHWACVAPAVLLAATWAAGAEEPETVVLRGNELHVWPIENLIRRGFEVEAIPREENAAWVHLEAANAFEDLPDGLVSAFDRVLKVGWSSDSAELVGYLDNPKNKRCMDLVRKAARMKRYAMPVFGDPSSSAIDIMLPNLSYLRFISKLMVVHGKRLEAQGKYDLAIDNYLTVMRMGAQTGRGITLIEGLVGIAIWTLGNESATDVILRRPLSVGQLGRVLTEYNRRSDEVPMTKRGMTSERAFGLSFVDELCSRPLRFFSNLWSVFGLVDPSSGDGPVGVNPVPQDGWGKLELRVGRLMFPDRAVKAHMSGYYDKIIERCSAAPHRWGELDFDEEEYVLKRIPEWDVLSRMLLPSLSRAAQIGNRSVAHYELTRTSVALRLSMVARDGKIPASLDEIADDLPENAMLDPFSGGRLRFRGFDDGWVLYSIGPDLVDDGGQQGKRWDKLDMVRTFPPSPREVDEDREGK